MLWLDAKYGKIWVFLPSLILWGTFRKLPQQRFAASFGSKAASFLKHARMSLYTDVGESSIGKEKNVFCSSIFRENTLRKSL